MPNLDLIRMVVCITAGTLGVVALIIALLRRQFSSDQPKWDDDGSAHKTILNPRQKLIFSAMIALIGLTALASLLTVLIAIRAGHPQ